MHFGTNPQQQLQGPIHNKKHKNTKPLLDIYGKDMWLKYLEVFDQSKKNIIFKLVKDSLDENIARETFEEPLELLIKSHSIKLNAIGNRECLWLPKENYTLGEVGEKKWILNVEEELENFKETLKSVHIA